MGKITFKQNSGTKMITLTRLKVVFFAALFIGQLLRDNSHNKPANTGGQDETDIILFAAQEKDT